MKLLRSGVLIILAMACLAGNAQIDIQRYTTATDTFYWKRYISIPKPPRVNLKRLTVSHISREVESFLAKHISQFPQFTNDSAPRFTVKDLKKRLFPVDINGDRLPDMIFSGFSGGESDIVRIWLNRRDSFELVFEDYQYISKFTKAGDKLVGLQTGDVGCCDAYLYFTRDYRVEPDDGKLSFIKGKQVVAYQHTEEPAKYYPEPIPFIARADTMLVRASAVQQNEPFNPHLDTFGNIIAKYRTRARGVALAYKTYGKGNEWFFVEISPFAAPSASILYDTEKMPTFIRGWVSGLAITLEP
jgi:hypothetical protein